MPHISYSELKDWVTCAFYHKLTRVDKLKGFKGNAFTAFGTAIPLFQHQMVRFIFLIGKLAAGAGTHDAEAKR